MRVAGDLVTIPAAMFHAPSLLGNGDARVVWGGVAASILFFTLALRGVYRLASEDTGDEAAAMRACTLLATYPFALFFSVPYSESLALLAVVSLTIAWRQRDARAGTVWGLVFGLCRSNGWTVALALAADRLLPRRPAAAPWRFAWLMIAAAPAGAALYSAYVFYLTGHPFAWAAAQHAWGGEFHPLAFVARRWTAVQVGGLRAYYRHDPSDALTFVAVAGMAAAAAGLAHRREWLYSGVIVAYLAPAVAIDLPATGRMTALLFPAFILLGRRVKGLWFVALVAVFSAGQGWFAWRFFLWRTPY
jgi:hypothetical protein